MRSRFFLLPALVLAFAGCDSGADLSDDATAALDLEDAADAIAQSVALDAGGALDDASDLALLTGDAVSFASGGNADRPGCTGSRDYDDSGTWTVQFDCERGDREGQFYAAFSRTTTYRFLDASGVPQQQPAGAASVEFAILSGSGDYLTPRASAVLTDLGASLDLVRVDDDMVSVDGVYEREGVRTTFGRGEASREIDYSLSLDLDDVTGPRARRDQWSGAVSGTISGIYSAAITSTTASGDTRTREVERSFTVTFPNEGGRRRARIAIGGRTFDADPATGERM